MKRTQVTDLLANIKSTFVSFFSILMFVALGVGVFLGISWAAPALQNAASTMFEQGSFHNFQLQFPYGLTDDDLAALSEVEGVSQIEAERQSFQTMTKHGKEYTVKVQSLGQSIDTPILVEGELPTRADELAFHAESALELGVNVGDTIVFEPDADGDEDSADALMSALGDAEDTAEDTEAAGDAEDTADAGAEADDADTASPMKYLTGSTFTVTAIVNNADYVAKSSSTYGFSASASGNVNALAWAPDDAFVASAYQDGYPVVNVRSDSLEGLNSFDGEYKRRSGELEERIAGLGAELATARYDDLHGKAQEKIDEAQKKLDEAEEEIARGEKEVAEGKQKLKDGRAQLKEKRAEGQAQLDEAYATLMDAEAKKADGEKKLSDARAMVNSAQNALDMVDQLKARAGSLLSSAASYKAECDADLASGKITQKQYNARLDKHGAKVTAQLKSLGSSYNVSVPTISHTNYDSALQKAQTAFDNSEKMKVTVQGKTMTLAQARKKLASAKRQLASAEREYNQKVSELNAGWAKYNEGKETYEREVANAEEQLAEGKAKLKEAQEQIAAGKKLIAQQKPKLRDAKEQLAAMAKYDWTILPRAYNAGFAEVNTFASVTGNLSISMAALFIVVGLLVSYFAVSRIVHEQVTQIGTKKALGFRRREITVSFLLYSGIAVLAGAIIGAIVAYTLVEGIIGGVLGSMFAFGRYPAYFGWGLFAAMTALELALVLGATYLACRSILKEHAVELLRGEKPPTGKTRFYEKWGIWDKLPLLIQTIVNNCVNDKRRVLSTIVGVTGCTALIVTAITLNNDVLKSYDCHYDDVYGFNAIAYVASEPNDATDTVEEALRGQGAATARVFMKRFLMEQPDGESGAMRIVVPTDEEAFSQIYHVHPVSGGSFDLAGDGAWVSQAYADHFGAKVGDVVTVDGGDGAKHEVPILGFYEFWLTYHEMVVGQAYYEKEFGTASANVVLTQTGDKAVADVGEALSGVAGLTDLSNDATDQYYAFATFSKVSSAVVAIYLALSALMAVVVLLNLNTMFIDEKKRELIVLMINGFSTKDARHYISYDNVVLTALGIIVGLVLGVVMGGITVAAIEPSTAAFVKGVDLWAVLIGIGGSAVLAVIMSMIALRRIPRFNLTDITRF